MRIVRAEEKHRAEWLGMRVALWPECPPEESSREIMGVLQGRGQAFLALDDGGVAIGFVEASLREYVDGCTTSPVGYIEGIYVRPGHRHAGVGRALVRAAEDWARERGCTEIGSDTTLENAASIAFHTAIGFRESERQVVFLRKIASIDAGGKKWKQ